MTSSAAAPSGPRADVFVSYAREDVDFVRALHDALVARGKQVWVDWESIPASAEWLAEVTAGIDAVAAFVFVLSPAALASRVCARELEHAVAQGKRIVPVVRVEPDDGDVPDALASRNWIFAREGDDVDAAVETLVEALDTDPERVRIHTRLLVRAGDWETRGRGASLLLRGADLRAAERWLADPSTAEPSPTPLQAQYVAASRRAAANRQRVAGATAVAVIAALAVLSVVALVLRGRAIDRERTARSRELAVSSVSELGIDPELSLILARRAVVEFAETPEAVIALRRALVVSLVRDRHPLGTRPEAAAFDPDGSRLVTVERDGTSFGWTLPGLRRTRLAGARRLSIDSLDEPEVRFSANGRFVVLRFRDASAQLRRSRDWKLLARWRGVGHAVVDGSSGAAVTTAGLGEALLRRDGRKPVALGFDVDAVAVGAGGRAVATEARSSFGGPGRHDVQFWRPPWRRPLVVVGAGAPAFSPDGHRLLVVGGDCRVEVRDGTTGRLLRRALLTRPGACPQASVFSRDGRLVATTTSDGDDVLWKLGAGRPSALVRSGGDYLSPVEFSRDRRELLTIDEHGGVAVWDAQTGARLASLRGHHGGILDARVTDNGRSVETVGTDGAVLRFRVPLPRQLVAVPGKTVFLVRAGKNVDAASFSGSGGGIAVQRFRLARRHVEATRLAAVRGLSFTAAGGRYAVVNVQPVHGRLAVAVVDLRTGTHVRGPLSGSQAAFSPGGRYVAVGRRLGSRVDVWQVRPWRHLGFVRIAGPAVSPTIALAPGGARVFVESRYGEGGIWDVRTHQLVVDLSPLETVQTAVFSRDGRRLALALANAPRVVDTKTGEPVADLLGAGSDVLDIAFSDDGSLVLTASTDGVVHVYDTESGTSLLAASPPLTGVWVGAFWPDPASIAAVGDQRRIAVYDCDACHDVAALVRLAGRRITRGLTPFERREFLHER